MPSTQAADYSVILWDNLVAIDNVTATTEASGFPASNLANPNTSQAWRATDTATVYVTVVVDAPIDSLAIAKHNLGSIGATVSLEIQNTFASGWTELVAGQVLPNDAPKLFTMGVVAPLYAVRLKIVTPSSPPQIAVMSVGAKLIMERGIWVGHTPITYATRVNAIDGIAESGDFLGSIVLGEFRESAANFQHLDPAFVRASLWPFLKAATTQRLPFFFQWRPATYPLEVGYVRLTNNPDATPSEPSHLYEIELAMRGVA